MAERWDDATYRANRAVVLAVATHCALCRRPLTDHPYPHPMSSTADHITARAVALRLGWTMARINALTNLQPAHRVCNLRKQDGRDVALALPPSPWE